MDFKYYICVTPFFPSPGDWRGAYVLDQVKAIKRNSNYEILVFKPCGLFSNINSYVVDGIKVVHLPALLMPSYFFNGFGGGINSHKFLSKLKEVEIDKEKIAVVHCHTAAFACYATAAKNLSQSIKTVMQYHDLDPYQIRLGRYADWKPNLSYRFSHLVNQFKNIDLHLCISERVRYNLENFPSPHPAECYEPYLRILRKAKELKAPLDICSYVLYNGVDTSIFYKKATVKYPHRFKIGCISNFNDLKDHITLIKSIELLARDTPDINLQVSFVGSGQTMSVCKDYIMEHNLSEYFTFESEVEHHELNDYYNSLDLFVLPSIFEGFGCVYTEAAACGVPFIGCIGQGYSEYISENQKDLWLIKPHDFRQLAGLIRRQYENPVSQSLAHSLDIDCLIKKYLHRIEQL